MIVVLLPIPSLPESPYLPDRMLGKSREVVVDFYRRVNFWKSSDCPAFYLCKPRICPFTSGTLIHSIKVRKDPVMARAASLPCVPSLKMPNSAMDDAVLMVMTGLWDMF